MKLSLIIIPLFIIAGLALVLVWLYRRFIRSNPNDNSAAFTMAYIDTDRFRGTHVYHAYFSDVSFKLSPNTPTKIIIKSTASSVTIIGKGQGHQSSMAFETHPGATPELTLSIHVLCSALHIV